MVRSCALITIWIIVVRKLSSTNPVNVNPEQSGKTTTKFTSDTKDTMN